MRRWFKVASVAVGVLALAGQAFAADTVGTRIEAGQRAWAKGDLPGASRELQAALAELQGRIGRSLAETMPAAPSGWQAEAPEIDGLGAVGGGLSVARAYTKAESSINASLILDSPAVESASALMVNPTVQPNLRRIKVGAEDALLRWDPSGRSGEVTLVVGGRVLVQIEGDGLASSDQLTDVAKGFNLPAIHKIIGG